MSILLAIIFILSDIHNWWASIHLTDAVLQV